MKLTRTRFAGLTFLALLCAPSSQAQQTVDNSTALKVIPWTMRYDFPGKCSPSQRMTLISGTWGSNDYVCGLTDNWIATGGGTVATGSTRASWSFCASVNCVAGDTVNVPYTVIAAATIAKCYASADTGPTGANLIVDITKAGTSIFGGGTKLVITAGSTTGTQATIANASLVEGDLLKASITQIGSTIPGKDLGVVCKLQ